MLDNVIEVKAQSSNQNKNEILEINIFEEAS